MKPLSNRRSLTSIDQVSFDFVFKDPSLRGKRALPDWAVGEGGVGETKAKLEAWSDVLRGREETKAGLYGEEREGKKREVELTLESKAR